MEQFAHNSGHIVVIYIYDNVTISKRYSNFRTLISQTTPSFDKSFFIKKKLLMLIIGHLFFIPERDKKTRQHI
jgi:hypothetical protein